MTGKEWAEALDAEMRDRGIGASDLVSHAFADGAVAGVAVAYDIDDDYGRVLASVGHVIAVRYNEGRRWWESIDPADVSVVEV